MTSMRHIHWWKLTLDCMWFHGWTTSFKPINPTYYTPCDCFDPMMNWGEFFSELYRAGYDGPIIIEHEDRLFEGTDEKVKRGFQLARDVLQPFIK